MKYNKIVLNIPHSSKTFPKGKKEEWESQTLLHTDMDIWTDVYTDVIFYPRDLECQDKVVPMIFPYSRFYCDFERLINDPLESKGQGIIYTNFGDNKRNVSDDTKEKVMNQYDYYMHNIKRELVDNTLLIDCHSFPDDRGNVDVCIGWNNDWSKPDEWLLTMLKNFFEDYGYKIGFNYPFSNALSPENGANYHSVMIELNKRIYLKDGMSRGLSDEFKEHFGIFNYLYKKILDYEG